MAASGNTIVDSLELDEHNLHSEVLSPGFYHDILDYQELLIN